MSPERELLHSQVLADSDYPGVAEAIEAFLDGRGDLPAPKQGAIAIASPITGDRVSMTNHPWRFSIAELRRHLGFDRLEIINDFTAQALALPHLGAGDKMPVGGGTSVAGRPLAVLGPGSGLGVSGLIPAGGKWVPLTGEGGHATMAPANERGGKARCSRTCAGAVRPMRLGRAVHVGSRPRQPVPCALPVIDGVKPAAQQYTAAQITDPEICAADRLCREATEMFCAMLGGAAGRQPGADTGRARRRIHRRRDRAAPRRRASPPRRSARAL